MRFGLCYIPDYHEELSGSWQNWYGNMIAEVKLADMLGFDGAWFAEHRVAGFAFGSPALFIAACARETQRIPQLLFHGGAAILIVRDQDLAPNAQQFRDTPIFPIPFCVRESFSENAQCERKVTCAG